MSVALDLGNHRQHPDRTEVQDLLIIPYLKGKVKGVCSPEFFIQPTK